MENEKGFTLIEMMIVVGIIAMLASIAIPNYLEFVARVRQVEAKEALSGMYTAEQGFFAEFNSYTFCLNQAGYTPAGTVRYYSTGYNGGDTVTCNGGGQTCYAYNWSPITYCDCSCTSLDAGGNDSTFQETASGGQPSINSCATQDSAGLPLDWQANGTNFLVGAGGSISSSPLYDMWQIDNNQKITNIQNGL